MGSLQGSWETRCSRCIPLVPLHTAGLWVGVGTGKTENIPSLKSSHEGGGGGLLLQWKTLVAPSKSVVVFPGQVMQ